MVNTFKNAFLCVHYLVGMRSKSSIQNLDSATSKSKRNYKNKFEVDLNTIYNIINNVYVNCKKIIKDAIEIQLQISEETVEPGH